MTTALAEANASSEIVVAAQAAPQLTAPQVVAMTRLVQDVMRKVMKRGEHFGTIPGCGDKPTLLKSGAEKLAMTFRLAPVYRIERRDIDRGHREILVTCSLRHILTGETWGEGVGCCSTLESKYRYRWESTGDDPPGNYWQTRDPATIGGSGFAVRKAGGKWKIHRRIENPDLADVYNTVLKIARKRALVDAITTATAASDIFAQDLEDLPDPAQGADDGADSPPHTDEGVPADVVERVVAAIRVARGAWADDKSDEQLWDAAKRRMIDASGEVNAESVEAFIAGLKQSKVNETASDTDTADSTSDDGEQERPEGEWTAQLEEAATPAKPGYFVKRCIDTLSDAAAAIGADDPVAHAMRQFNLYLERSAKVGHIESATAALSLKDAKAALGYIQEHLDEATAEVLPF